MSYRQKGRLLIHKEGFYPVPIDSQSERWYIDHLSCHGHDQAGERTLEQFLMLDDETSDKIRAIQQEANDKILNICRENYQKAEPLTWEYHQKIVAER